jgi:hypothetical protein
MPSYSAPTRSTASSSALPEKVCSTPLAMKLGAKSGSDVGVYFTTSGDAIDDDWQAVRFVYRREDRPR